MKQVGLKLKNRREELGYTIDEMSIKTKIQPHYLKALEDGDLGFFKDDISYLRYFLRFYCQALVFDFDEIKNDFEKEVEIFTETQSIKAIEDRENTQKTINKRIQDSRNKLRPEKKKLDYTLISLVLVVLFMIGAIGVFVVKMGPSLFAKKDPMPTPVITAPSDNPLATATPEPVETSTPETSILDITTLDGVNYEIRGWKADEQVSIRVEYGRETWMRVSYNGIVTDNPASKTYLPNESMEILVKGEPELDITIHFGALKDNKIFINNVEYTLDARVKDVLRGQQIHFILKGE